MKYKINEKEYTLEYTFEAVANEDCVRKTIELISGMEDEERSLGERIAIMPNSIITLFYAGLLEHHSEEIKEEKDAKQLLKQYMKENKDDDKATFYGVMLDIIEQMGTDGFFKQVGLGDSPEVKKTVKKPQDHKRKTTTTKKTEA